MLRVNRNLGASSSSSSSSSSAAAAASSHVEPTTAAPRGIRPPKQTPFEAAHSSALSAQFLDACTTQAEGGASGEYQEDLFVAYADYCRVRGERGERGEGCSGKAGHGRHSSNDSFLEELRKKYCGCEIDRSNLARGPFHFGVRLVQVSS